MRIFYKTYHTKYITPSFTAKPTRRARGRSQARRLDCKHRCSWSGARTHLQTRPVMEARNVDCLPSATTNSSSRPAADSVTVATWELVDSVTVATWELADPVTVATWELIGKLENWQTWPRVSPTGVRNWFPCTDWLDLASVALGKVSSYTCTLSLPWSKPQSIFGSCLKT